MFKYLILLAVISSYNVNCNQSSVCCQNELLATYLEMATYAITKANGVIPKSNNCEKNAAPKAMDCEDLLLSGHTKSGVYTIWPVNRVSEKKPLEVYCDMDTDQGGWTVIQRRGDFGKPKDYFYKDWKTYKVGFGDIQQDFWLGNDNIYALSNQKLYSIRFDLRDVEGSKRYALYDKFWIEDEIRKYTIHISDYSGDAGDSMLPHHNNVMFSTKDQKNDNNKNNNCAVDYKGAWWYMLCHESNLNGLYLKGKHESFADGINWKAWKGFYESLEWTEMKIRPKNFRQ